MRLTDIFDKCNHLKTHEQRCIGDEFIEIVFYNEDGAEWFNAISAILGAPRKDKNKEPNRNDLELTSHTGGIRFEQTLFEKEYQNGTIIAKFWPWKDNIHTTLRMALLFR